MKLCNSLFLFLLLIGVSSANYTALSYVDRPCGSDLTNLWLDVVAVVDNSKFMTDYELTKAARLITKIFSSSRIGTDPNQPKTTRLGLVTYNANATIQADLNKLQSVDDMFETVFSVLLNSRSSSWESYLGKGLVAAQQVFVDGSKNNTRTNYGRVVIVLAASFSPQFSVVPITDRLKLSGVTIVTMAYNEYADPNLYSNLAPIASRGYNFTDQNTTQIDDLQRAMLEINCFCPYDWTQYQSSLSDPSSKYGTCLRLITSNSTWSTARFACQNARQNAFLVNEFTQNKHDFVLEGVLKNVWPELKQPYTYHIGLFLKNGVWVWDQPQGWLNPPLGNWTNWMNGNPVASSTMPGVWNTQEGGGGTKWQNIPSYSKPASYACEVASCDTDNYCESIL